MKPIQMADLTAQYRRIENEINSAISDTLSSGQYINGAHVEFFATELANYLGVKHVIPCANGTDALQIALMALDLQTGDEVIVPNFTYIAAIEAVALLKLKPVLIDVDPKTFNINVELIEQAISPRTKAIIPVHLFGQTADMEPLMHIARKHNLFVIEDNAQGIGSVYTFSDGTKRCAGSIGDIGTLSFFPSKNLGCYGDGGALLTNNETLALKLRMIAAHGQARKYEHEILGCNSRLDTLQAAMLRVKLLHLDSYIRSRQQLAERYDLALCLQGEWLEIPHRLPASSHVYNQYTLKIGNGQRDAFRKHLNDNAIPSMIYYPSPVHRQPAYKSLVRCGSDLSMSEILCKSVISLPMHTEMSDEQAEYLLKNIAVFNQVQIKFGLL